MKMDEGDKPKIEKNGIKFPDELKGLIGEPPLLEGENPEHFWSFFQAVVDEQKPQGILDWVSVIDMAIKCWEELRLRRSSAAVIRGGMVNALIYFLRAIRPPPAVPSKQFMRSITSLALQYFSKKPKEREEVIALLAQHGITLAELQAKAAELNGEPLHMFERMIAARENGRRMLRKEAQLGTKRQKGSSNLTSEE